VIDEKLELSKEEFEFVFFAACHLATLNNSTIMMDRPYAQALLRQWRSEYLGNKHVMVWVAFVQEAARGLFDALAEEGDL